MVRRFTLSLFTSVGKHVTPFWIIWVTECQFFIPSRILEEEFEKRDALENLREQQEQELEAERQRREKLEHNLEVYGLNDKNGPICNGLFTLRDYERDCTVTLM